MVIQFSRYKFLCGTVYRIILFGILTGTMHTTPNQDPQITKKIAAMEETQRATEAAMAAVIDYLRLDSEPNADTAHEIINQTLTAHDCESPEGHIVAAGKSSAEPHEKGSGPIPPGVPIVIDIYPRSKKTGYFADMSRTVCIGTPTEALTRMYAAVLAAQTMAIDLIKPDLPFSKIQAAVEAHFTAAGYKTSGTGKEFRFAEGFVHSIGHGVGQAIHEPPFAKAGDKNVLRVGDVITIEPGLYYPDIGGARIEDMLLVTADGALNLTTFPKHLVL
jgi:Xaa-Pro aminopeptidase